MSQAFDCLDEEVLITIVDDPELLQQIYKQRYSVSISELNKKVVSADHVNKIIYDKELDNQFSTIVCAITSSGNLIGSVRINWGKFGIPRDLYRLYSMDTFSAFSQECFSFASRLIIDPKWRNGKVVKSLFKFSLEFALEKNCCFSFISCRPGPVAKLYNRFGYQQYDNEFMDDLLGPQIKMVCIREDVKNLIESCSVFGFSPDNRHNSQRV
jgi:hypothetical protein